MAVKYTLAPTVQACDDGDSHTTLLQVGCFQDCDRTDSSCALAPCSEGWNCNLCQTESQYLHPYVVGDVFYFQTQFVDPVNEEGSFTAGWGTWISARLVDENGFEITSTLGNFASEYVVGYNGEYYYQTIAVDTSLFASQCWGLEITMQDEGTWCSGIFQPVGCEATFTMESTVAGSDCCQNWYGEADDGNWFGTMNLRYSNFMRLRGELVDDGATILKQRDSEFISTRTHTKLYLLVNHEFLPPYVMRMQATVMEGDPITVDGGEYRKDNVTIRPDARKGRMQLYSIELEAVCVDTGNC